MIFKRKSDSSTTTLQLPENFELVSSDTLSKKNLHEMIAGTWLFANIDQSTIKALFNYAQCYQVAADTLIFKEGDSGHYMCLLISGQVEIYKEGQGGKRHHLASIGYGKTFGEMAIIDNEHRSATCIASQDSTLLLLSRENFGRIVQENPTLAITILIKLTRLISHRLRNLSGQVAEYLDGNTSE